ncbi:molybdenum cofactor biosynthesis protein MoaE [Desulfoluna butyratoxydans]|uniref:Molybdopterin synthase catalytic subunit n=1 Tax=Desulfoluna butyratoxydans TaxID=231438 RepID=A0A4U8YKE1_9BACT|nr:molybdenum cofactor biosynthesis protein MoaE [Desulfoluna butyratoxydans]VFQ43834.1 molybdopterin biosynthesis moae [Desulfoluna butyratoxydans]
MIHIAEMIQEIKAHPDFGKAGMVLAHNGVVRESSRDGRPVTGLTVHVNHARLDELMAEYRSRAGIVEILIAIEEEKPLAVGDDVMAIVVAGDIRENVLATLEGLLNAVKAEVTSKTEHFTES